MNSFKVYPVNPAVQRGAINENVHFLIATMHIGILEN